MPDLRAFRALLISFSASEEITLIWFDILCLMARSYLKLDTLVSQVALGTFKPSGIYISTESSQMVKIHRDYFVKLLKALIEIRLYNFFDGTCPAMPETKKQLLDSIKRLRPRFL